MQSDKMISDLLVRDALQRALLGAIYPAIRAIAFRVKRGHIILRVYLDRPPNEDDFENASVITTEVLAYLGLKKTTEECVHATAPIGQLDSMDGFAYARKEG